MEENGPQSRFLQSPSHHLTTCCYLPFTSHLWPELSCGGYDTKCP